jgi:hypothetical protein
MNLPMKHTPAWMSEDVAQFRDSVRKVFEREFVPHEQYFDRPYRMAAVDWRAAPERDFRLDSATRTSLRECIRRFAGKERDAETGLDYSGLDSAPSQAASPGRPAPGPACA